MCMQLAGQSIFLPLEPEDGGLTRSRYTEVLPLLSVATRISTTSHYVECLHLPEGAMTFL